MTEASVDSIKKTHAPLCLKTSQNIVGLKPASLESYEPHVVPSIPKAYEKS